MKNRENINEKGLKPLFGWVGGKSQIANEIVKYLNTPHSTYVEGFAGALSVLYAKNPSKIEVINDLNSDLINLHLQIRNNPERVTKYLEDLLISRELHRMINNGSLIPKNDIERAAFYWYNLAYSFSSKIGGGYIQFKKGRGPKKLEQDFKLHSQRLKRVSIENKNTFELIKNYDEKCTLFYLDPPYVGTEKYYRNVGMQNFDHQELFNILKQIKGKFCLSYNDCELIRGLYKDFNIFEIEVREIADIKRAKQRKELLITNYDINPDLNLQNPQIIQQINNLDIW